MIRQKTGSVTNLNIDLIKFKTVCLRLLDNKHHRIIIENHVIIAHSLEFKNTSPYKNTISFSITKVQVVSLGTII